MNVRQIILALVCGVGVFSAHADIGVAVGHHTWSKDASGNYLPEVGPQEQVSVFHCVGPNLGAAAESCALKKCVRKFGGEKQCVGAGWSRNKGYSVVYVGPPGSPHLLSKSLGDATRAESMAYVKSNNFPMKGARKVIDLYDDTGLER